MNERENIIIKLFFTDRSKHLDIHITYLCLVTLCIFYMPIYTDWSKLNTYIHYLIFPKCTIRMIDICSKFNNIKIPNNFINDFNFEKNNKISLERKDALGRMYYVFGFASKKLVKHI